MTYKLKNFSLVIISLVKLFFHSEEKGEERIETIPGLSHEPIVCLSVMTRADKTCTDTHYTAPVASGLI